MELIKNLFFLLLRRGELGFSPKHLIRHKFVFSRDPVSSKWLLVDEAGLVFGKVVRVKTQDGRVINPKIIRNFVFNKDEREWTGLLIDVADLLQTYYFVVDTVFCKRTKCL